MVDKTSKALTRQGLFGFWPRRSLRVVSVAALVVLFGAICLGVLTPKQASAATGIESELAFQGKVVTSAGLNIPDGTYNMEYKIYSGCTNEPTNNTGCTAIWTEDYLTSNATYSTTTPVTFTSGTYQVNLGSICAFSGGSCEGNTNTAINWNTYPLYLSLNVGTTANCSAGFASCGGGDGAMNPYVLLTSTPYSLNSNEVGGDTLSQLGVLAANNTWTGTNAIQDTSTTAFEVQSASGASTMLAVNTSGNNVTLGSGTDLLLQGGSAYISNPQGQTEGESFGNDADVEGQNSTSVGYGAYSGSSYDTTVGAGAITGANFSIALGAGTNVAGSYSFGLGAATNVAANDSIGLGYSTSIASGDNASIAIGQDATATASNQLVVGGNTGDYTNITNAYFGSGVTDTAPTGVTIHATGSSLTGVAGASLTLQGGNATTGTASGGNLVLQGGVASGSGSGGSVIVKPQTNSTTAFEVQNASGTNVINVDTTDQQVSADQNSSSTTAPILSVIQNGSSSSTVALQNSTTNSAFYLSDNVSNGNAFSINSYTGATTTTATPTFVQQASVAAAAAATSTALAFSSNNTLGNTIVVAVSWNTVSSLTPTCSDSQGNTYSAIVLETDDPDNSQSGICYATNIKAGANTVTVTFGASVTYRALAIQEYSGIATTSPVDTYATYAATGTTATNAYTSTTAATTTSGDLIFGYFVDETGSTATATAGTGFTQRTDNTTLTSPATTEDMVQSSAGSIAATQTENQAHVYTGMMMAFKPSTTTGSLTNTNTNDLFTMSQSGQTTFKNAVNSTSAFQVQNTSGSNIFNVNTNSGGSVTVTNNVSTASPAITTQSSGYEWDNYSTSAVITSLAVTPHAVGDLMMFYYNFGSSGDTVTGVSGGGVSSWHLAAETSGGAYIYEGTVTSAGSSTIYITYSGNNTIYWDLLAAQEFSSAYGANTDWSVVVGSGPSPTPSVGTSTSVPFPSLTTTQANQMYWGTAAPEGGETVCATGFTCKVTTGGDFIMYDSATTANTAYAPVATQSSDPSYSMGTIVSANPASGTALSVSGASQVTASSTSALQVQNTAGGSVFNVDTANDVITSDGNIIVSDNSNCNYTNYTSYISSLNPTAYWKLEDGGTSASDNSGNGDTGTLSGVTAGVTPGPFSCAPSHPAMAFSSGSSSSIQTANTYVNPESYTETVMFKTTSYGPLIGFVNPSTNNFDRLIYVGNNGELYAGIYPGTTELLNSTQTVNNGVWHMAVLTQSSAGLFLYLDGSLVASNATYTTAETATSYWDIGYSYSAGWTNQGSAYFTGDIAEAAVLPTALTSTQVATLAGYGIGNGNTTSSIGIGTSSPTANLDDAGTALFQAPTNSATAFLIENAGGANLLTANTSSGEVIIGTGATGESSPDLLVLDTGTTSADPTEVNGAIYYNSNLGLFRCGQGGAWVNCVSFVQTHNINNAASAGTTTSSTYANMPGTSSVTFTKSAAQTKLIISVETSMYDTVAGNVEIGVTINGSAYNCAEYAFNAVNTHETIACTTNATGIAAGSVTVQMQWKVLSGGGTLTQATSDWISLTAQETD